MVLVNTSSFFINGLFRSGEPFGDEAKVELQYVVIHEPDSRTTEVQTAHSDDSSWVVKQLGVVTIHSSAETAFHAVVPAKMLKSTWSAVSDTKKAIRRAGNRRPAEGTFHTYIRAEVVCLGAQAVRPFQVYSSEVYLCGERNLRRIRADTALV